MVLENLFSTSTPILNLQIVQSWCFVGHMTKKGVKRKGGKIKIKTIIIIIKKKAYVLISSSPI